jgi:hypothetical protein
MTRNPVPAPDYYLDLGTSKPFTPDLCVACGYDPRVIYEHNFIVGYEENNRIECSGQLCLECAETSAHHRARIHGRTLAR